MVRVGGGWVALDEFLVKNDPCRGKPFLTNSFLTQDPLDTLRLSEAGVRGWKDLEKRDSRNNNRFHFCRFP